MNARAEVIRIANGKRTAKTKELIARRSYSRVWETWSEAWEDGREVRARRKTHRQKFTRPDNI